MAFKLEYGSSTEVVADDVLLVKKAFKNLLEPLFVRINAVRDFLAMFKPGLIYDIVPITDVYGPAGWDEDIQALVVSKETLPGAAASEIFSYWSLFQLFLKSFTS